MNTIQLTATPLDAAGLPLTGRLVTWTSDNPAVATVDASGLVQAVSVGSTLVHASCEGLSAGVPIMVTLPIVPVASLTVSPSTAILTVPPVVSQPIPPSSHEPAGLTLISDLAFPASYPTQPDGSVPGMPGWGLVNPNGHLVPGLDLTAPLDGGVIADFVYPIGHPQGSAPATLYREGFSVDELYFGFWWKPSNPWQDEFAGVNKLVFLVTSPGGVFKPLSVIMERDAGGHRLEVHDSIAATPVNYLPNVAPAPISLGIWHYVEIWCKRTGGLKWWLDGTLRGDYPAWICPTPFTAVQFSPTWGGFGNNDIKSEVDHFWFSHIYLSGR